MTLHFKKNSVVSKYDAPPKHCCVAEMLHQASSNEQKQEQKTQKDRQNFVFAHMVKV